MKQHRIGVTATKLAFALVATSGYGLNQIAAISTVKSDGSTAINLVAFKTRLQNQTKSTLSKSEHDGLVYMREEEKLAFDVYNIFSTKCGPKPFGNISRAEQSHMDSVKVLLNRFEIADPMASSKAGKFTNQNLQKLYDRFIKSGQESRIEALKIGATIEDLDLFDLDRWMKTTNNEDIKLVYGYLAKGSRNHLRAFVFNLRRSGTTYKPQYISQEAFQKIVDAPTERATQTE